MATLGAYAIVHHHRLNRELRDFGVEVDPVKAAVAIFPGCLILVPPFFSVYRTATRIATAQETVGLPVTVRPGWAPIAALFALIHIPYLQAEANRAWNTKEEDQ